ncbi:MAG TPA: TIGR03435 family protein [Bryobacteraceae bacterium]|nr:TIGR03435 family protein [Bryobacteraceae bacterium]
MSKDGSHEPFASFEAATIKPVQPEDYRAGRYIKMQSAHQFLVKNTTVSGMIAAAFDLNQDMVGGGPKWVTDDRYDIVAVTPGEERPTIDDQMKMLRQLLVDRFKLQYHTEKKIHAIYLLSVAKGGPKLDRSEAPPDQSPVLTSTLFPAASGVIDHVLLPGRNTTIRELASMLQRAVLDRPVVDETGLNGRYDFDLEWTPDQWQFGGTLPLGSANSGKPSLYAAIERQLGLKLTSTRGNAETLVIDGVDRPSAN